ncbi:MAG: phosphoribosylformylglycinamidine synthase subunit PurL [Ilumatobacteraceae bacterium]
MASDHRPGSRSISRYTVRSRDVDPRAEAIRAGAATLGLALHGAVDIADVVFVEGDLDDDQRSRLGTVLADPLLQVGSWDVPVSVAGEGPHVEITLHPGVTDGAADAVLHAGAQLGVDVRAAATGRRIGFPAGTSDGAADVLLRRLIANPIIEHWATGRADPDLHPGGTNDVPVELIAVRDLDETALARLGAERSLALDPEELLAIRRHFTDEGREPTDVELETLAQTWSEHCAHKTFRAAITVRTSDGDDVEIAPLIDQLRAATDAVAAPFVRSAFVGNAGIVSFCDGTTIALKAETHNHPSAVEPFGGANTGVGGVIRDVMGAAHRPIACTDVLCFGPPDLPIADLPDGALHPRRIRDGVIDGVADYGNKIGLPTVAGAVIYDPGFTTNPLVFCGCVGVAEDRPLPTGPFAGDRVVVLGGRTGRDGIRGATFSSTTMDATTGAVAGASVQIGDPVTEKLLIDVLDGADELWTAITDCGAGGLSSAIGEMAEHTGADVELTAAPLKYPGLAPWEIWLSEAQERMVVAVPPTRLAELRTRCIRHGVELADLGTFTGDGRLVVRHDGEPVLDLDTRFLHDGRPKRQMMAEVAVPDRTPGSRTVVDPAATLLALLGHRDIASKAATIHRYDHEIGGGTVVRPLVGVASDGPGDGVVLADPRDSHGIAIGIGVNPWYGLHDPEAMAHAVIDEAIRNVVAVGADPERVALLDNFSWGDPRRPSTLGDLVAAVRGCRDAALAFGAPFVSGKDSLNNEYTGADGHRHAVPPTLVITAVAHVPDVGRCVTAELTAAGNVLFQIGPSAPAFAGSHLDMVLATSTVLDGASDRSAGAAPQPDPGAPQRYVRLHRAIRDGLVQGCHDISEGGLAVALAELCIAGRLGADIDTLPHDDPATALFAESTGRLVAEVAPADVERFVLTVGDVVRLGTVTAEPVLRLPGVAAIPVADLATAFLRGDV